MQIGSITSVDLFQVWITEELLQEIGYPTSAVHILTPLAIQSNHIFSSLSEEQVTPHHIAFAISH